LDYWFNHSRCSWLDAGIDLARAMLERPSKSLKTSMKIFTLVLSSFFNLDTLKFFRWFMFAWLTQVVYQSCIQWLSCLCSSHTGLISSYCWNTSELRTNSLQRTAKPSSKFFRTHQFFTSSLVSSCSLTQMFWNHQFMRMLQEMSLITSIRTEWDKHIWFGSLFAS